MMSVTSAEKELKELKKQQKAIEKKIKQLDGTADIAKGMAKWEKISNVKSACEKLIKEAKLGRDFDSLLKLHNWPEYFIYQHPGKKTLKTSDINAEWVQYFIGNIPHDPRDIGQAERLGTAQQKGEAGLQTLRETADKTKKRIWKTATKKQADLEFLLKNKVQIFKKLKALKKTDDADKSSKSPATAKFNVPTEIIKKKVASKKKVSKKVATRK